MALSVFGDKPAGLTAFTDSGTGDGDDFRMAEHIGDAVIVTVHGPKEVNTARYGLKTAISCDVVVLDGKGGGTKYEDVLIFNAAPVDQLKNKAGQMIAATIGSYESKSGTVAPRFEEPTPEVVKAAEKYLASAA